MRVNWVDNAKALGIVAIVAGHAPGLNDVFRQFLYTFHVPLFFFLSGYLLKPGHLEVSFLAYFRRNTGRLVVPYFFFWFLSALLWLAFQAVAGKKFWENPGMLLDATSGVLMGTSASLLDVNGVLWFYTSLFTAALVFYWLAKNRSMTWVMWGLVGSAGLAAVMPLLGVRLPWNIDLIFIAMVFYGAGFVVRDKAVVEKISSSAAMVSVLLASGAITAAVVFLNKKVDMSWQLFGNSYALFLMGAFSGIVLVIMAGKLLPATRLSRYLADNAIVIYSIHFPMFFAFWGVGVYVLNLPSDFDKASSLIALLYIVGAFLLCLPVIWFIRRFMPWGLGPRGIKAAPVSR